MKELFTIQQKLLVAKKQKGAGVRYTFRSAEDIYDAAKPFLEETHCTLVTTDDIVELGGKIYFKATAILKNEQGETETATAFAQEESPMIGKDGKPVALMGQAQYSGATSSYARKYALCGLFCIGSKDADDPSCRPTEEQLNGRKPQQNNDVQRAIDMMNKAHNRAEMVAAWDMASRTGNTRNKEFNDVMEAKKKELGLK